MKSVTAYKRSDGIYLHAHSQTTVGLRISTEPFLKVGMEEQLAVRGEAIISVLNASMLKIVPHPKQEEWDGVFAPMLRLAGVRSLRAFEKGARCCSLDVEEGQLTITPHRQIKPSRGYKETLYTEPVKLPFDSSPIEIAAALEEGFNRC